MVRTPTANARNEGLILVSGRSPGEGHGNPLQYSCLENPMDRGAWWATVHGVTESQTQLSVPAHAYTHTHTHTHTHSYLTAQTDGSGHHLVKAAPESWVLVPGTPRPRPPLGGMLICQSTRGGGITYLIQDMAASGRIHFRGLPLESLWL